MKKSIELRQERTALLDEADKFVETLEREKRPSSKEEQIRVDSTLNKISLLNAQISVAEADEGSERDRFEGRTSSRTGEGGPRVSRESQVADPPTFAITAGGESIRMLSPSESLRSVTPNTLPDNAKPSEFDWGRAIKGMALGDWRGADLERRTLVGGSGAAGGYLIPDVLAADVVDLARNQSVIFKAGARTIPMPAGDLSIARLTSDPTAYWTPEAQEITEDSAMAFGAFVLKAKKLACLLTTSVEVIEDAQGLDGIIRNAVAQSIALKLDYAILRGEGGPTQVQGLITWVGQTPGVQAVEPGNNGAALSGYDNFLDAMGKVYEANGDPRTAIYAPRTWKELQKLKEAVSGKNLDPPPAFVALEKFVSNQISVTLAYGSADDASEAWLGDFRTLLVGVRTEMQLEVSRVSGDNLKKGLVSLRAYTRADFVPLQPAHICWIGGIIPPES